MFLVVWIQNPVRENDILTIDQEKVKVLDILPEKGQLRILRAVNGTTAGVHTNSGVLYEDPRKFMFRYSYWFTNKYIISRLIQNFILIQFRLLGQELKEELV